MCNLPTTPCIHIFSIIYFFYFISHIHSFAQYPKLHSQYFIITTQMNAMLLFSIFPIVILFLHFSLLHNSSSFLNVKKKHAIEKTAVHDCADFLTCSRCSLSSSLSNVTLIFLLFLMQILFAFFIYLSDSVNIIFPHRIYREKNLCVCVAVRFMGKIEMLSVVITC